jgi:hypothetical protein
LKFFVYILLFFCCWCVYSCIHKCLKIIETKLLFVVFYLVNRAVKWTRSKTRSGCNLTSAIDKINSSLVWYCIFNFRKQYITLSWEMVLNVNNFKSWTFSWYFKNIFLSGLMGNKHDLILNVTLEIKFKIKSFSDWHSACRKYVISLKFEWNYF